MNYLPLHAAIGDFVQAGMLIQVCPASHIETVRFMLGAIASVRRGDAVVVPPDYSCGPVEDALLACRVAVPGEVGDGGGATPIEALPSSYT